MSLYQQPDYRYPPRFPGPAQPFYHQPPPPPPAPVSQPFYHVDPVTFRRDYSTRLAELTVNSRPIIQSLSMLAQDYSQYSSIVAQCLEAHIRKVPPWMKLPAFYLLDAITKNVFDPYAREFSSFVIQLFLETYNVVDQSTRGKMEEMLITWRNSSPTGKELFGAPVQIAIERGVWGGSSFEASRSEISVSQVLSELEFTLSQKDRVLKAQPYDSVTQTQITVLHRLREVVQRGVSQNELKAILDQLRSMMRSQPAPQPPRPSAPPAQSWAPPAPAYPQAPPMPPQSQWTPNAAPYPSQPPAFSPQSSTTPAPPAPAPVDISALLSNLVKAGVVTTGAAPTAVGSSSQEQSKPSIGSDRDSARQYRQAILQQPVKLNSLDILKTRSPAVFFLYDQLPLQCKQCSMRFADTPTGKKERDEHIDAHFEQARRGTQNVGRGHSRNWFINVEDWVQNPSNLKGKGRADGVRTGTKPLSAEEAAKRTAELKAQYVVIPPGSEAQVMSCPICKEKIKTEFLEDDEEWVWRNATKKDGKVYHATCHAEAAVSTSTLVTRLKTGLNSRSRSTTPETATRSPRLTPTKAALVSQLMAMDSLLGTKRKAEPDHDFPKTETPPLKKLALVS